MGNKNSVEFQEDMHVVIAGGGYSGSYLAVNLLKEKLCKVTMIDPKDAMVHHIGALRAVVDESYTKKLFLPYNEMLGDSFRRGTIVNLNTKDKEVELSDGQKINYTHLVIATGSSAPFPGKVTHVNPCVSAEEAARIYDDYRKEILSAKRVLVVGGGAVGVELAGEIKTDYNDKEVTIVNAADYLVTERGPQKFQNALNDLLRSKKITVVRGEKVSNMSELNLNKHEEGQVVKTESGKEFQADIVIPCTGTTPNNAFYKETLAESLTEQGLLKVDKYLQVVDQENIYAVGDVNDVKEEKMAYTGKHQVDTLLNNLKATVSNGSVQPYERAKFRMLVPVGRNEGTGVEYIGFHPVILFPFLLSSDEVKSEKCDDLYAEKVWKECGMEVPSST